MTVLDSSRGKSLLVVDDEALVLLWLEDALSQTGYQVVAANDADGALDALSAEHRNFAAIITDIDLGRGRPTGWDVADRARASGMKMPVIYISGKSAGEWTRRGVADSVMLSKPFALPDVLAAIDRLAG